MNKAGKVALLLLLCGTNAAGFLWLPPAAGPFANPGLARIVVFHVPCAIVASIASVVASYYAIVYLAKRRPIDDSASRVSFSLGLLFWVLTTATGAIFAKAEWGAYWSWDPKESAILMLLMIYIAYFALRAAIEDPVKRGSVAAAYSLFAVIAVPYLSYILPNATPNTLHPKGVVTTSHGLSSDYRIVLWLGVLGLMMVYVWALRVHIAVERVALDVQALTRRRAPAPAVQVTDVRP